MNHITLSSALVFAAASAHAQTPQYSVLTNTTVNPGCSIQNSPTPASVLNCINRGGCAGTTTDYGDCSAIAQPHSVWTRLEQTRQYWMNSCGGGWRSNAEARTTIPVVFSGPGNGAIQVRPRIAYEAVITFSASDMNPHGGATQILKYCTGVNSSAIDAPLFGMHHHPVDGFSVYDGLGATIEQIGPLTWRASGTFIGNWEWVLPNVPETFTLSCEGAMHNGDITRPIGQTTIVFGTTTHLSDVQAFDLPPGYTVNAPEYSIVDNRWVDPRIARGTGQPSDTAACSGNATFAVTGAGEGTLSYQWRKDSVPLANGATANGSVLSGALTGTLSINGATEGDEGQYDCVVSNAYGSATSSTAVLTVCAADFNCDTDVDFFDYLDFVGAFSLGSPAADFNGDGDIDFFDYLDFVGAFSIGC